MASVTRLEDDKSFWFCDQYGNGTGDCARSYTEFKRKIRIVPVESLEYHMYRASKSDFEVWFKRVLKRVAAANKVSKVQNKRVYGKDLRKTLIAVLR